MTADRTPFSLARAATSAALVAAVAVIAGCSAAAPAAPTSTDWSDSPLNTYLATVWGNDVDQATASAQNDRVEQLVATCMSGEGFEYTAVPTDQGATTTDEDWRPQDEDWVAQWGYGAVDWPGKTDQQQAVDVADDPNAAYLDTLSETERDAYYAVLYGPQPTQEQLDASGGMWTSTWQEQGCYGAANHQVHGDDATTLPENTVIMDAINAFYTAQQDDPALAGIDRAWSDCMAGAGHGGFAKQGDALQSIYDASEKIWNERTDTSATEPPELAALHGQEVQLALADLHCQQQTGYQDEVRTIQWGAEDRFIADHRAELDALVADAQAARASAAG